MNEVLKLAQNRCANYGDDGRCLVTDRTCLYGSSNANIRRCSYFETSVLPAEPAIEMRYYASRGKMDSRPCCENCGNQFNRTGGRQIYCVTCAKEIERVKRNKRNRQYREERKKRAL
ncbi:cysteine-rich VLP protein [Priestia megaterium]|uniref:cysteine-rich VLP protein n=1 Tax=Priestia megaterium TaxID=1404 RepID=UPI003BF992B8